MALGNEPADTYIETMIGALDDYCEKHGIKVCLVLDEFQEICNLKHFRKIEALLRGSMQMARNVTFMMLGSRRSILKDMFLNRHRPFYKIADIMALRKIPEEALVSFVEMTFRKRGVDIPHDEARQIVKYCNCYPYYVQKLVWIYLDIRREGHSLEEAQNHLLMKETPSFEDMLLKMNLPQRKLLRAIAAEKPRTIFTVSFFSKYQLDSHSGVQYSLKKLKTDDLVEQQDGQWRVVDSILEKWLLAF